MATSPVPFITPDALLHHWQGHRRLTRRVIEAFPDDKLFTFSIGGMRTFGALSLEMLSMAVPMVQGAISDEWKSDMSREARPKQEILGRGTRAPGNSTRSSRRFQPSDFKRSSRPSGSIPAFFTP